MNIEIKSRWTGAVLFSVEAGNIKAALEIAVKSGANLYGANLDGANLDGANLTRANLTRANLTRANLTRANLDGANLTRANLTRANLDGANLTRANLDGANLTPIRDDVYAVLSSAPGEVKGLLKALKEGHVDGSTYQGKCACLVGTLANVANCDYREIDGLTPNSDRAAERFFMLISAGDTPETNPASKIAAEWVEEWLTRMEAAFKPKAKPRKRAKKA